MKPIFFRGTEIPLLRVPVSTQIFHPGVNHDQKSHAGSRGSSGARKAEPYDHSKSKEGNRVMTPNGEATIVERRTYGKGQYQGDWVRTDGPGKKKWYRAEEVQHMGRVGPQPRSQKLTISGADLSPEAPAASRSAVHNSIRDSIRLQNQYGGNLQGLPKSIDYSSSTYEYDYRRSSLGMDGGGLFFDANWGKSSPSTLGNDLSAGMGIIAYNSSSNGRIRDRWSSYLSTPAGKTMQQRTAGHHFTSLPSIEGSSPSSESKWFGIKYAEYVHDNVGMKSRDPETYDLLTELLS